jgi:hypothetical protein
MERRVTVGVVDSERPGCGVKHRAVWVLLNKIIPLRSLCRIQDVQDLNLNSRAGSSPGMGRLLVC